MGQDLPRFCLQTFSGIADLVSRQIDNYCRQIVIDRGSGMSPFEMVLLKTIETARRDQVRVTASTVAIMARLPVSVPDRTLRHYLRVLENRNYVYRPLGPKSGWAVTLPVRAIMKDDGLAVA